VSYGLGPRPELGPEETAAVIVAVTEVLKQSVVVVPDTVPVWRFSGRWFNTGPFSPGRPHPLK